MNKSGTPGYYPPLVPPPAEQEAEARCTCRRYGRPEPTCAVHSVPQEAEARRLRHIVFNCECRHEQTAREALDELDALLTALAKAEQERDELKARLQRTETAERAHYKHAQENAQMYETAKARERELREALVLIAAGLWASQGGFKTGVTGARDCARQAL